MIFTRERTRTSFVQLDTRKCEACWKCIENCSNGVISKVDLPWHRHALIVEPDACTGCLDCMNICQYHAYSIADRTKQASEKTIKRTFNSFLINNLLLVSGLLMGFSGLVLQLGFHMGGPDEQVRQIDTSKIVCGLNYPAWSVIHKFVIVFFSLLMIYHTFIHWKWYKVVITKNLIGKNRQVFILSVLFLLVAVTGLVPWFIDLSGSTSNLRMLFIEIHDKLTLILIAFLILHIAKRAKWFTATYEKLKR